MRRMLTTMKMKIFLVTALVLWLYVFISYIFMQVWFSKSKLTTRSVVLPYVIVHVDMKGTPLKLSYLESLLPMMKNNGVTGLLMEYEDMFPYEGKLVNLSAENCYSKIELKRFLKSTSRMGMQIIPLVQTFGHLEHALKLAEFQHLREEFMYPDSICPSKTESVAFLRHMLEQVITFHSAIAPIKYIHIGCDEVFHINKCQNCVKRVLDKSDIFLRHVNTLSGVVRSLDPHITALIWDDMLRMIEPNKWNSIDHLDNVRPVCWDYNTNLQLSHKNLYMYHQKFKSIWIASAYKGADGITAIFPDARSRFLNTFSWMNFILGYKFGGENDVYNFKGIILTGWSRYSHMEPPCELMPVAYPSLLISLLIVKTFKSGIPYIENGENKDIFEVFMNAYITPEIKSMQCALEMDLDDNAFCDFVGNELFIALRMLARYADEFQKNFNDDKNGLEYIRYYAEIGFLNMNTISSRIKSVNQNLKEIADIENKVINAMCKYYKSDFVTEYVTYKTYYIKNVLQKLQSVLSEYVKVKTWPRRVSNSSFYYIR